MDQVCELLRQASRTLPKDRDKLLVLPLYAGLPPKEQFHAFDSAPYQTRKVVVATNIAETSVTIAGVVYGVCSFCFEHRADEIKITKYILKFDLLESRLETRIENPSFYG